MDLTQLKDWELDEVLQINQSKIPKTRKAKINAVNSLLTKSSTVITEPLTDLIISNTIVVETDNSYISEQIYNLTEEEVGIFAQVFGLTSETVNINERLIRILKYKGMINDEKENEIQLTVELTGARPGEYLIGVGKVIKEAIIKINNVIPPSKKYLDIIRRSKGQWAIFLEKIGAIEFFAGLNKSQREEWLKENEKESQIDIAEVA